MASNQIDFFLDYFDGNKFFHLPALNTKEVHQINGLRNHFLTGPLRVKKVVNDNTLCQLKTRTICFMRAENVFVLCQEIGSPAECADLIEPAS